MQLNLKQLFRFSIAGVVNSILGYSVIFILLVFSVNPIISNFLGYIAGLSLSFMLSKNWVFKSTSSFPKEVGKFLLTFLICYLANLCALVFILKQFEINVYIAQIISGIVYFIGFYFISKNVIFTKTSK